MERFVARGRNPHSDTPVCVASWPAGPDWPAPDKNAARKKPAPRYPQPQQFSPNHGPFPPDHGPRPPQDPS
jgi:hypothetical protein